MKKLLFVLMLATVGNTLAAPASKTTRNTGTVSIISESERKEIEKAIQSGMQPFINTVTTAIKTEINKQSSKLSVDSLFSNDYIISSSLKKEIGKKYADEIIKVVLNIMEPTVSIKKINYISQNEVEVNYDMKIKNLDKVWDSLDFDEKMERNFLAKTGVKNLDEVEKIMKSKGNEDLKKKYYYVMLEEMVNGFNEELKKAKDEESLIDEETLIEDMSVQVKKINGKWQVENLEKIMRDVK